MRARDRRAPLRTARRPAVHPAPPRSGGSVRHTSRNQGISPGARPRRPRSPGQEHPPGTRSPAGRSPRSSGGSRSRPHRHRFAVALLQHRSYPGTPVMQQQPHVGRAQPDHPATSSTVNPQTSRSVTTTREASGSRSSVAATVSPADDAQVRSHGAGTPSGVQPPGHSSSEPRKRAGRRTTGCPVHPAPAVRGRPARPRPGCRTPRREDRAVPGSCPAARSRSARPAGRAEPPARRRPGPATASGVTRRPRSRRTRPGRGCVDG